MDEGHAVDAASSLGNHSGQVAGVSVVDHAPQQLAANEHQLGPERASAVGLDPRSGFLDDRPGVGCSRSGFQGRTIREAFRPLRFVFAGETIAQRLLRLGGTGCRGRSVTGD